MNTTTTISSMSAERSDTIYHAWLDNLAKGFRETLLAKPDDPLFVADVPGSEIWNTFLANIEPNHRQHYTCNCCRHFFERFGGVVLVSNEGDSYSPIWSIAEPPRELARGVDAQTLANKLAKARETTVARKPKAVA